jgi:hypothetical protein
LLWFAFPRLTLRTAAGSRHDQSWYRVLSLA